MDGNQKLLNLQSQQQQQQQRSANKNSATFSGIDSGGGVVGGVGLQQVPEATASTQQALPLVYSASSTKVVKAGTYISTDNATVKKSATSLPLNMNSNKKLNVTTPNLAESAGDSASPLKPAEIEVNISANNQTTSDKTSSVKKKYLSSSSNENDINNNNLSGGDYEIDDVDPEHETSSPFKTKANSNSLKSDLINVSNENENKLSM